MFSIFKDSRRFYECLATQIFLNWLLKFWWIKFNIWTKFDGGTFDDGWSFFGAKTFIEASWNFKNWKHLTTRKILNYVVTLLQFVWYVTFNTKRDQIWRGTKIIIIIIILFRPKSITKTRRKVLAIKTVGKEMQTPQTSNCKEWKVMA